MKGWVRDLSKNTNIIRTNLTLGCVHRRILCQLLDVTYSCRSCDLSLHTVPELLQLDCCIQFFVYHLKTGILAKIMSKGFSKHLGYCRMERTEVLPSTVVRKKNIPMCIGLNKKQVSFCYV